MFHPLTGSLLELTDDQITSRITQLFKIMKGSRNPSVIKQSQQILDEIYYEQRRRLDKKIQEEFEKNGSKFNDIIDIK